ncbi:hypothetical protein EJ06DRAFT_434267 [Trichodelitschia bisporula]|uniref:Uncharacterized protein n=1 Tax=Trichodelitschia bisporula TaxID=703511 RepID=A0A6G1HWW8_9PEZI|nr:hypothetical protein EJ06DRAFT_434267 [Trichodelitschia bisporula]
MIRLQQTQLGITAADIRDAGARYDRRRKAASSDLNLPQGVRLLDHASRVRVRRGPERSRDDALVTAPSPRVAERFVSLDDTSSSEEGYEWEDVANTNPSSRRRGLGTEASSAGTETSAEGTSIEDASKEENASSIHPSAVQSAESIGRISSVPRVTSHLQLPIRPRRPVSSSESNMQTPPQFAFDGASDMRVASHHTGRPSADLSTRKSFDLYRTIHIGSTQNEISYRPLRPRIQYMRFSSGAKPLLGSEASSSKSTDHFPDQHLSAFMANSELSRSAPNLSDTPAIHRSESPGTTLLADLASDRIQATSSRNFSGQTTSSSSSSALSAAISGTPSGLETLARRCATFLQNLPPTSQRPSTGTSGPSTGSRTAVSSPIRTSQTYISRRPVPQHSASSNSLFRLRNNSPPTVSYRPVPTGSPAGEPTVPDQVAETTVSYPLVVHPPAAPPPSDQPAPLPSDQPAPFHRRWSRRTRPRGHVSSASVDAGSSLLRGTRGSRPATAVAFGEGATIPEAGDGASGSVSHTARATHTRHASIVSHAASAVHAASAASIGRTGFSRDSGDLLSSLRGVLRRAVSDADRRGRERRGWGFGSRLRDQENEEEAQMGVVAEEMGAYMAERVGDGGIMEETPPPEGRVGRLLGGRGGGQRGNEG